MKLAINAGRLMLWVLAAVSLLLCVSQVLLIALQRALGEVQIEALAPYRIGASIWTPVALTAVVPAIQLVVDVMDRLRGKRHGLEAHATGERARAGAIN